MVALVESTHAGQYILSEANFHRSRDKATLVTGLNLKAGAVLGMVSDDLRPVPVAVANAGNVGNGVFGAITRTGAAKLGNYAVTMTSAGATAAFTVTDPDGVALAAGAVGSAYNQGGLAFTIADGATDFAIGDGFVIPVANTLATYSTFAIAGATLGVGILYEDTDTLTVAGAKQVTLHVRDCEVLGKELVWDAAITSAAQATAINALEANGIIVRP